MVPCVVNTRYTPARTPPFHRAFDPRIDLTHRYQKKGFISYLFSHTCALLRPQPLCFDTLHKNTRGEGDTTSPTVPSPIGTHAGLRHEEAEGFLALLGMTTRRAPTSEGGHYKGTERPAPSYGGQKATPTKAREEQEPA